MGSDEILALVRFVFGVFTFLAWLVGQLVQLVHRLSGRRSSRLDEWLSATKEENSVYWWANAGVVVLVLVAMVLVATFEWSVVAGWVLLVLLAIGALIAFWRATRRTAEDRTVRFIILGALAAMADLVVTLMIGQDYGGLSALGFVLIQVSMLLALWLFISRHRRRRLKTSST